MCSVVVLLRLIARSSIFVARHPITDLQQISLAGAMSASDFDR